MAYHHKIPIKISSFIFQLTEDGVITESGQFAQKCVEEESKQGKESVTTLFQKMEEQSVKERVWNQELVTSRLVQLTEDGVITESGQFAQKSVEEGSKQGKESVTTLFQKMEEQSVKGRVWNQELVTSRLVQLTGDGVITESGQFAQKSVEEGSKQGKESVTTLFQKMEEQSVKGRVWNQELVTSRLVQLTGDGVITESGQFAQKSVEEGSKQGKESVTTLFQKMEEQSVKGRVWNQELVTSRLVQLTGDGVITESGQFAQKNVEEGSKQGKESVTTLLRQMEEQSVKGRVWNQELVTSRLVQLTEDGVIMESGQFAQKSVEEESKQEKESVTTLFQQMEEQSVKGRVWNQELVTSRLVQLTEDGVIMESGQFAQKCVEEGSKQGKESVTTLFQKMEEQSVKGRVWNQELVTSRLVQVRIFPCKSYKVF